MPQRYAYEDSSIDAYNSACDQLDKHISFDRYAYQTIDENFAFTGTLTDAQIISEVQPKQPVQQEEEADDTVEQLEERPRLSTNEALESLKNIHHYFLTHPEDSSIEARKVQSLISSIELRPSKTFQSKISTFLY